MCCSSAHRLLLATTSAYKCRLRSLSAAAARWLLASVLRDASSAFSPGATFIRRALFSSARDALIFPPRCASNFSRPHTVSEPVQGQAGRSNIRIQLAEGMGRNNKGKNGFCDVWEPERGQDFWKRKRKERINQPSTLNVDVHGILRPRSRVAIDATGTSCADRV